MKHTSIFRSSGENRHCNLNAQWDRAEKPGRSRDSGEAGKPETFQEGIPTGLKVGKPGQDHSLRQQCNHRRASNLVVGFAQRRKPPRSLGTWKHPGNAPSSRCLLHHPSEMDPYGARDLIFLGHHEARPGHGSKTTTHVKPGKSSSFARN
ncbi:hypothetical protein N7532_008595 [Penicillium argentinense]|uniref:Uncharacterized protein n=1 Tax=Penicillium argentinense TaxID=1131581 RepID=A0A9W9K265_9EURO|nr:uncharacterized protein N7532_008595 [Penicillium argentinense]KAJ5089911.1 hypothetical protein N7532_008595 [Penicillium argentinense]